MRTFRSLVIWLIALVAALPAVMFALLMSAFGFEHGTPGFGLRATIWLIWLGTLALLAGLAVGAYKLTTGTRGGRRHSGLH